MSRSVYRATQILESLGTSEDGLSLTQITKTLEIPKSSVSVILNSLLSGDFISLDQSTKKYKLGSKILFLAHQYLKDLDLVKMGTPIAKKLSHDTGESVAIYVKSGDEAQMILRQNSPQPVSRFLSVGSRAPMYTIAAGKIFLAFLADIELENYLSSTEFKPFTRHTITDPNKLLKELKTVGKLGIAYNIEEYDVGVTGIGAPINDSSGNVIAALVVVAPSFRVNEENRQSIENALRKRSAEFSHQLGFG